MSGGVAALSPRQAAEDTCWWYVVRGAWCVWMVVAWLTPSVRVVTTERGLHLSVGRMVSLRDSLALPWSPLRVPAYFLDPRSLCGGAKGSAVHATGFTFLWWRCHTSQSFMTPFSCFRSFGPHAIYAMSARVYASSVWFAHTLQPSCDAPGLRSIKMQLPAFKPSAGVPHRTPQCRSTSPGPHRLPQAIPPHCPSRGAPHARGANTAHTRPRESDSRAVQRTRKQALP